MAQSIRTQFVRVYSTVCSRFGHEFVQIAIPSLLTRTPHFSHIFGTFLPDFPSRFSHLPFPIFKFLSRQNVLFDSFPAIAIDNHGNNLV